MSKKASSERQATEIEPIIPEHDERKIKFFLENYIPFFLEGPPGIGKSLYAKYYAQQYYNCDPLKIDITEDTEVRHILGEVDYAELFRDLQASSMNTQSEDQQDASSQSSSNQPSTTDVEPYFEPGPLVKALQEGRPLIIEELDRAGRQTLFSIFFDALEYKQIYVPDLKKLVPAEPQHTFNVIVTVNRQTDIGVVELPDAFLRRMRRIACFDPSVSQDPAADLIEWEKRLVRANLDSPESVAHEVWTDLDETQTEAFEDILYDLLGFIYYLRRQQNSPLSKNITPSESVRFTEDFLCMTKLNEKKRADNTEKKADIRNYFTPGEQDKGEGELKEILRLISGALVKNSDDLDIYENMLEEHFVNIGIRGRMAQLADDCLQNA